MVRLANPFKFGTDAWDASHRFETSWLLPPLALFACRAVISLYIFVTRFFVIGYTCTHDDAGGCTTVGQEFSYFTVLTYWGMAFYFLVAAIHTFTYARSGRPFLAAFPRPVQSLHALFYTTIVTFPFLVTIVYWGILYEGPWFPRDYDAWRNVSQHLINSFFALFEIIVPRTHPGQMLGIHILWLLVILALYLALAYLTHETQGFYTYSFLDPEDGGRGRVAGYVLGIAAAIIVVFLVAKLLVALRYWVTERKLHMEGKFAGGRATRAGDEEMQAVRKESSGQTA